MLAGLVLALALPAAAEPITPAGDAVKGRDALDGRALCAAGKVVELDERFGRVTGKHLFRAKLDDGTGVLQIFAFGFFPKVADGERIEACGRFNKAKRHKNGVVYENEIEVVSILKGAGIGAGKVEIVGDRVVPVAKGKVSAQASKPPSPAP